MSACALAGLPEGYYSTLRNPIFARVQEVLEGVSRWRRGSGSEAAASAKETPFVGMGALVSPLPSAGWHQPTLSCSPNFKLLRGGVN